MNCRFCGNFVPTGSESCPVCGRRSDERPIAELLAENKHSSGGTQEMNNKIDISEKKKRKTGLLFPLLLVVIGAVGWFYIYTNKIIDSVKSALTQLLGSQSSSLPSGESEFAVGEAVTQAEAAVNGLTIGQMALVLVVSLCLLIGVILVIVRLANRARSGGSDD